ncbi:hypothetical protein HELRODRAFT_167713 [Helobdella robusta]|uniref:Phospholipase A2 domain-containing protein n=1 Tax=Helobdella robusta TaxID=6412 RepID=T1EZQ0_HELRO|nr:hypothetical protein HELRODRAFT_167713 [Helobdella robusta]ESO09894.1 hypothetical protein HELRODRAFT_167713 [Helobdella robusta]
MTLFLGLVIIFTFGKTVLSSRFLESECQYLMKSGSCNYYKCLNEAAPCGHDHDFGYEYCERFDHHGDSLTADATRWVNSSRVCVMELMSKIDFLDTPCSEIKSLMKNYHKTCDIKAGLCSFKLIYQNFNTFKDVAKTKAGPVYFLNSMKGCPAHLFKTGSRWVKENVKFNSEFGVHRYKYICPSVPQTKVVCNVTSVIL